MLAVHLARQHQPATLVNAAKRRWRIEPDYQGRKQELGLGHYEG
jgi:SRSO17 transposase